MKDLRKLSDKELKEMGDFASSASIINNFGSFLNNIRDGKEKESWRDLVLLTTDFINTVAKGKSNKLGWGTKPNKIKSWI